MTSSPKTTCPQAQRSRRGLKIAGVVTTALLAGWVLFASINIVSPSQGELQSRSDAVVSLAPQAHRLPLAEQLVEGGNANTLVISYFPGDVPIGNAGAAGSRAPVVDFCEPAGREDILCLTPEQNATIGEAYAVRGIAQEESLDSLTVVTDQYHVFRSRFIFEQCLDDNVDVNVVFFERDLSVARWGWHIAYENVGFLKAVFQTTFGC